MKKCQICLKEHNRRSKYCSIDCSRQIYSTKQFKDKVSIGRKTYLKNNPDKHVWKRNSKFISEPCEELKRYLANKGLKFVPEWEPIDDRSFSIDIAFPDIKVGIEVNGNQHYESDGKLKQYYQERHDLISSYGWTLIELHYTSCYNHKVIDSIIQYWNQPDYTEYFNIKKEKDSRKKEPVMKRGEKRKIKNDIKWEPFKSKVINSDIDFKKFGWVKKVSLILGIKEQKVNKWMKRYLPDLYERDCFKRKNAVVSHGASTSALIV